MKLAKALLFYLSLAFYFAPVANGDAVIFSGNYVKALKANLKLLETAYIVTGTADPSSSATDAPKGSLYLRQGATGAAYVKTDNGSSTNWTLLSGNTGDVVGPGSATDNALTRFDGTTGKLVQNSVGILSDAGALSGTSIDAATNTITNISNTEIKSAAAIALNKLAATTISSALVSDGSGFVSASSTTAAQIAFLNTASSNIQTQLNAKEPTITVLPISKGGTNSGTALNNNRIAQTSAGAIIEAPAITASRALVSDANGIPTQATTTSTEIGYVNGVTSAIQTQLNAKEPSFSVLPISKGGTNSGTALNNNRIIQSSGGAEVEAAAITANRALISDANGIPTQSATTSTELGYSSGVTSAIQTQLNTKVTGPASSTDNAVTVFDSTTGKLVKNSVAILSVAGGLSGLTQLDVDNIRLDGNTISSTDTNGNLNFTPNGTGNAVITSPITTLKATAGQAQPVFNLSEDPDTGTDKISFQAPADVTTPYTITYPAATGVARTHQITDGSGTQSWNYAPSEINLVQNPTAAQAITSWTASGAGITVARTTTGSDLPMTGIYESAIKITPVSGTSDYVSYCVDVPVTLASTKLKAEWYQRPLAGYTASDLTFQVFSYAGAACTSSATQLALSTDNSSAVTSLPNVTGKYTTTFNTLANASGPSVQVRFLRAAGTTALNVTNLVIGPGVQPQGAVVQQWQSYTPVTAGLGTPAATSVQYRRVGDSIEIRGFIDAGTTTATTLKVGLPAGLTVDTSIIPASARYNLGTASCSTGGGGSGVYIVNVATMLSVDVNDAGNILFYLLNASDASGNVLGTAATGSGLINTGGQVNFWFTAPISQWAGAGTVNVVGNTPEYACVTGTWDADATTTQYGPSGCLMGGTLTGGREKTISWQTTIQPTDRVEIWASKDQINWFPINGSKLGASNLLVLPTIDSAGTVASGVSWRPGASANQSIITFSQYINAANDDSPAVNWPSSAAYWVAVKAAPGQAIGFGLVAQNSSGLVSSAGQLLGTNTNDSAATGYVGEYMTSTNFINAGITVNTNTNLTSLVLTAGDWDVTGWTRYTLGTAVSITATQLSVSTTTVTHSSDNSTVQTGPPTALFNVYPVVPNIRISVAAGSTQTVFLVGSVTATSGTPNYTYALTARRRR